MSCWYMKRREQAEIEKAMEMAESGNVKVVTPVVSTVDIEEDTVPVVEQKKRRSKKKEV